MSPPLFLLCFSPPPSVPSCACLRLVRCGARATARLDECTLTMCKLRIAKLSSKCKPRLEIVGVLLLRYRRTSYFNFPVPASVLAMWPAAAQRCFLSLLACLRLNKEKKRSHTSFNCFVPLTFFFPPPILPHSVTYFVNCHRVSSDCCARSICLKHIAIKQRPRRLRRPCSISLTVIPPSMSSLPHAAVAVRKLLSCGYEHTDGPRPPPSRSVACHDAKCRISLGSPL